MTNVMQFPGGRYAPPVPDIDAEMRAAELELMRAQAAHIRSETRELNALRTWFWCKRILAGALLLWLLSLAVPAKAQNQTTFRDSRGSTTGTATRNGDTTVFRDAGGRTTGTATRSSSGTTTFRDAGGRTTGTSSGPRR